MTLCLHAGAEPVEYDALRNLPVPAATETHVPIPHHRLVDMLKHSLTYYNHEVSEEHYGVTADGARFFGVITLKDVHQDYSAVVGLRNSHDKSFPVGVSYGSRTFVCDNLAFMGDHVIKRKHTAKALRDIHALLAELVEPLATQREAQHQAFNLYKATPLDSRAVHHAVMECYERGVIGLQRIPEIMDQWHEPTHDWGEPTAWRFFNCVTFALAGRVAERPALTNQLHQVLDRVCEKV